MYRRSSLPGDEEDTDADPSFELHFRTYVFPTRSPQNNNSDDDSTETATSPAPPHRQPYRDDASPVDLNATESPSGPATARLNTAASAKPAAAATGLSGLRLFLNVEELQRSGLVPARSSQRVRFADTSDDAPAQRERRRRDANITDAAAAATPGVHGDITRSARGTTNDFTTAEVLSSETESDSSEVDSESLEPYSMITKTGGVHISLYTQLLALLQRTYRQYMRHIITLVAEIVSPLLFVVLLIILDAAFGKEKIDEVNPADPIQINYQIDTRDYQAYLCYNDSTHPINGLVSCANLGWPSLCDGDESGIPVHGLCYSSYFFSLRKVIQYYVPSMMGSLITIPTLDSIILHQWLAKKAGLAASSRSRTALAALSSVGLGVSATTRYDSISYSGKLYFAPAAKVPKALLEYIRTQSALFDYVDGGTFETVAEAEHAVKSSSATQQSLDSIWGLVIIHDIEDGFDVQIRLHGAALPSLKPPVSVEYRSGFLSDGTDMYFASGFLSLQKVLYDYFYSTKVASGSLPNVAAGTLSAYGTDNVYTLAASFPWVHSRNPYLLNFASSLVAFIVVLSFLYPFSQMTKRIVLEKELRIRESMCIMGLNRASLWLNFLLVTFLEYVIICILLTILLCAVVATRSSSFTIFLILLLYSCTLIPLSGLLSTFFSRARMAALMSPLIYFVLSMPIFAMGSAGANAVLGLSILSPTGLASLLTFVFAAEAGSGFHPNDFHNPYFSVKPYLVMIIVACDVVLYLLIMFYLDLVLPQEWGSRMHPLFFVTAPYKSWKKKRCAAARAGTAAPTKGQGHHANSNTSSTSNAQVLERSGECLSPSNDGTAPPTRRPHKVGPGSLATTTTSSRTNPFDPTVSRDSLTGTEKSVGVRVDSVSKYFVRNGERFAAVKDISWNMYRGEISVLLGPNGAGKSTTINVVTGMLTPNSGDCFIEGHSVTQDTTLARHEIGYCPQHNILWPDLTCREHLEFYGKIKGLRGADLEDAVVDILRAVDLEEKIDAIPTLMSGGQRRKLSVAIAFVGRNRVVLLDEPTTGMDPAARRHIWSLLRVMAVQRTIMLTTHYMDEADLLGDNVAIVNDGVMQCAGTTQFLRRYAGVGYTVHFDLSPIPTHSAPEERQAKVAAVWAQLDAVVRRHLVGAKLALQTDAEVEYEMHQQTEACIPEFLKEMESRGNRQIGIRGYALKAPTLEDVFMRVVEHQVSTSSSSSPLRQRQPQQIGDPATTAERTRTTTNSDPFEQPPNSKGALSRTGGAGAGVEAGDKNNRGGGGNGSLLISPSLATPPLQRRMSRASRHFFNGETLLNYGDDAEPSEEDDDADSCTMDAVMSFSALVKRTDHPNARGFVARPGTLYGNRGGNNNSNSFSITNSNTVGGGGKVAEPSAQASSVFVDRANRAANATGRSPLASESQRVEWTRAAAAESAHGSKGSNVDGASPVPTVVAKVQPANGGEQETQHPRSPANRLNGAAVRNEAFLYKHVTDRHLAHVWATRTTARRGNLWALQLRGMMYKRVFCAIRDRRMLFFQIICPVLCILLAMLLQLVKDKNNGTVQLSPRGLLEKTMMPVSGCAQYYGPVSLFSTVASDKFNVEVTDPNFVSAGDMANELLDTWHTHKYGRYVALQCANPLFQRYMQLAHSASLGGRTVVVLLYNTSSHNSLPISLHTAYAMAYYTGLGNTSATFEMSVTSLPENKQSSTGRNAIAGILIGVIVLIPFTFLPANPVAWVVKEYETRARHLQTVSGLNYLVYWAGNFLFDFTSYVVCIVLVMIIFVIFQRSEYIGYATIGPTIVAFALYGVCYCCMSYMVSFFFSEHTAAQLVVLGISFLTGFLCVMLVFVLSLLEKTLDASDKLRWVFRLLPPYSLGEVILNLALLEQKRLTDTSLTAWSMSITLWPDIYMAIEIPVFAAITLLWDHPNRRAVLTRVQAYLRSHCCCGGGGCLGRKQKETRRVEEEQRKRDEAKGPSGGGVGGASLGSSGACGGRGNRRGSVGASAAVTPFSPPRPQGAQTSSNNVHVSTANEDAGHSSTFVVFDSGAFLKSASPGVGQSGEDKCANSLSVRGRSAVAEDTSGKAEASRPESVLVLSVSAAPQLSMAASSGSPSSAVHPLLTRLPTVLFNTPEDSMNRTTPIATPTVAAASRRNVLRRRSDPEAMRLQASAFAAPPAEMIYPPLRWYVGDDMCLEEEDSDVEEERNAVYSEERLPQAEGHPAKRPRTPTSASKESKKKSKKERGGRGLPMVSEDHQPQSAAAPEQVNADVIRVVDLRKVYDTPHKVAVSDLTFSVMHGEVFGFLGTNGAGKSSALSILTQEQPPTSGRAYVCGHDVVRDSAAAASCLGYCPQFDACLDLLTVKEHLRVYSLVRGVSVDRVESLVSSLLAICNLTEYRHVLSGELSGGNRRKLSVAIALIGAPKVVCLDEPTSGLDPLARRVMWRALDRVSCMCSIILTTHHLEEVEALADCVGIMVDGGLRCFGDLPHLRHKYARNAYELTLCVSATSRRRAMERRETARHQALAAPAPPSAAEAGRRGNASTDSPHPSGATHATSSASFTRSRMRSISYAGIDHIDTTDDIFQFMLVHFPSALLVDNFNNERFVYTLPATRDVAYAMQRLQNQQQRRGNVSFRSQSIRNVSTNFGFGSISRSNLSNPILRLSDVFEKLQAAQESLGITEYSVSQVSLEQVFLRVCGTAEEAKKIRRMSQSMAMNEAATSPGFSRSLQTPHRRQSHRLGRSSSIFVNSDFFAPVDPDAPPPSRRRLNTVSLGGPPTRVTFSEYRRQRALMRLRADARKPIRTPSETEGAAEPDQGDPS
ncbi:ATP-binding cassette protein subfamily A member 7 putative (ABCA7) [Leptomonas pyrrhocoris]|uniref:ATP-binding cassette protein subfamily A member 7 putative (ABCA7) n=1 Tax=Leptomonas pyrrhocoris TaxID=157538 RepID=A0A0N0VDA9_LEPPY|nr:ATP-binding cassette protein subfamily A member 7 putative (ABCA7) [Leptomonas pyrrhocoris]KPA75144.1 ATP-binding cassette protein subfamily A member 7 putative (ABCA7) [Leptomonas pyrrhocoris]|eukprot:XP_015653583.1 ATP-binding cassette protein subfamily A member 7 putative (ABCA7) [Leptomonas pyrrhocoris]